MRSVKNTRHIIWIVSAVIFWLCSALPATAAGPVELNYRLKWLFNTSVAGDIMAREAGFFEKAGLDVTVKEGGPEKNAIKELELGYADFGVASADQVI
ncbi:MAG: ABC transporter substrate-binding protein, partial [Desulfobacterales bacterium]|nr:ABC transporter substrate-binding protein [Desulfobacterales bacterium]